MAWYDDICFPSFSILGPVLCFSCILKCQEESRRRFPHETRLFLLFCFKFWRIWRHKDHFTAFIVSPAYIIGPGYISSQRFSHWKPLAHWCYSSSFFEFLMGRLLQTCMQIFQASQCLQLLTKSLEKMKLHFCHLAWLIFWEHFVSTSLRFRYWSWKKFDTILCPSGSRSSPEYQNIQTYIKRKTSVMQLQAGPHNRSALAPINGDNMSIASQSDAPSFLLFLSRKNLVSLSPHSPLEKSSFKPYPGEEFFCTGWTC